MRNALNSLLFDILIGILIETIKLDIYLEYRLHFFTASNELRHELAILC